MQLNGQLRVVREAIPLEEFLALDSTTEAKKSIAVIMEARASPLRNWYQL